MAAVALLMAACSNDDELTQQAPVKGGKMHFTATIGPASGGTVTRTTYTEVTEGDNAGTIDVAWVKDDEIALIHGGKKDVVAVLEVNEDGSAVIDGEITLPETDEEEVVLVYPAESVDEIGSGTGFTPNATYAAKGLAQDGTLAYIQDNLDGRQGSGTIVKSGEIATLKNNVTMESQIAIWKISLTDDAIEPEPLEATKLTLRLGAQVIAGTDAVEASDEFYLCVVPATLTALYAYAATIAPEQPTPEFTIEATVGGQIYTYKKAGALSLEINNYYQSTVALSDGVDIGLFVGGESSGPKLLWAKMNVGAETETDAGLYFAWGDVTGRSGAVSSGYTAADGYSFNWVNYTHANGDQKKLTKYCNNSEYGNGEFTDELTTLVPDDDAATANWGGSWRMPTYAELNALLATKNDTENYSWEWKTNYNGSGMRGYLITYTVNGNSIFLPTTGYRQLTDVFPATFGSGYYWSSTLYSDSDNPSLAWSINFRNNEASMDCSFPRYSGFTIRPVKAGN